MIRKLAFILLLIALGLIGYFGFSIYEDLQRKQAIEKRIATLPEFTMETLEGEIKRVDGSLSKPLILTYFDTDCHFCQAEIRSMRGHAPLQKQAVVYLVSDEHIDSLRAFAHAFELDSLQSITVFHDVNGKVRKLFGVPGVPNTFVYNTTGKLLANFKGETKAEIMYQLVK